MKANVIKLYNGITYIPNLGSVRIPKRLYWIYNRRRQGWLVVPLDKDRVFFPVYGNDDVAMKYKAAVRELSRLDRPLRNSRIIQTREYANKVRLTGMAGVRINKVRQVLASGVEKVYTYVEASGTGILDNRRWVVEGSDTLESLLEVARDYRRGVVDLWHEQHELTVEDCTNPIGEKAVKEIA